MNHSIFQELPGTKPPKSTMEGPMAPAAYVIEDGLVGKQWERGLWSSEGSVFQGREMPGQGSRS